MSVLEVIASSQRDARGVRGVLLPCRVSLQALKPRGPDHAGTHTAPRDPLSRARRAGGRTLPIPLYIVGNFRRNSEVASASSLQLRNNTKDKNTTNVERTR